VVFVRRGGARLVHDTIETNADPTGYFYLQAAALEPGDVVGDIIASGEFLSRTYVIQNVTLNASVLDRLPSINAQFLVGSTLEYALLVRYRGTAAPAVGAVVEFRRTGGVPLTQAAYTATVDSDGRVVFQLDPANEQAGEVVGDVTVRAPLLSRPYVVHGVHLATFDATELRFGGVLNVGYAVESAGELFFRGDRAPLAGAEVQFVRTGGLATTPSTFSTRSLSDGRFGIIVTTDTAGDVVGDLIVRRDSTSAPLRITGVRLPAVADDSVRYMGRFALGAQILYNGVLVQRATQTPAAGWTVVFRRTGGIPLVVDTLASTVVDWGGFALDPSTRAEGVVDGTLEAHAPDGGPTIPLGPVHLQTFDDDSVRLAGRWAIGPSLLYVGELRRADNDAVVVGARVEFRRTGGIAVAESVLVSQSNVEGRFRLAPTPLAEGEVIGALHIVPPAPLRDTTITDVHLTTFDTDEVRLGGVWRLVP
jgi:hypothetical protein